MSLGSESKYSPQREKRSSEKTYPRTINPPTPTTTPIIIRFDDELSPELFALGSPLARLAGAVTEVIDVEKGKRALVVKILLEVLPSMTVTIVDVTGWVLLMVDFDATIIDESDRVEMTSKDVLLSVEVLGADVSEEGDDVLCGVVLDGDNACDEIRLFDDGVVMTEESESAAVGDEGDVDVDGGVIDEAVTAAGGLEVGWALDVTPVPIIGTFCLLWCCRAMSM